MTALLESKSILDQFKLHKADRGISFVRFTVSNKKLELKEPNNERKTKYSICDIRELGS